ncbi:hypothetical protein FisN_8Lh023 [Fistulifera solaris]|uniref:PDZ domain-containing protein n=1 Tax=Fistulifera solaris TaxID=1519565 RepID=A0A1Z5JD61_FISSO|nr:hypothetical protein FisN_8Lh023 [Fistulifera solaris]|eukprot:GAX11937.1 hypothetical protein FisN_8Lh023 [Fistulifera solaris]
MGFFSKIFRRNKSSEATTTISTGKRANKVRLCRRNNNKYSNNTQDEERDDSPTDLEDLNAFVPIARGPDFLDGSQRPSPREYNGGPVDLDEVEASTVGGGEEDVSPLPTHHQRPEMRLSSERLAEFTQQIQQQEPHSSPRSPNNHRTFTMDPEPVMKTTNSGSGSKKMYTPGQLALAVDDRSESSSFNLSTDAEDTEYEDLKKHGIVRKNTKAALQNKNQLNLSAEASVISFRSSPSHQHGTEFPNLLTDDDGNSVRSGPSLLPHSPQEKTTTGRSASSPMANNSVFSGSYREAAASPKSSQDNFANFADFSSFGNDAFFPKTAAIVEDEEHTSPSPRAHQRSSSFTRHTPSVGSDSSISELLAQAKSHSSRHQRSGNTVNSAPAMTAAQIRAHHGIQPRANDGTSVSDIIKSLEADNASRMRQSGNKRHSDAYSTQSRDASVRSAKERLRRRRESNSHPDDASTESDEDAESWLMDEVTGALGPRGIAADLESLSGRSHKSHRSHHSRKSRPSTRRRSPNSGESVDSQGSKRSSGSRRSRYSHRSTKSYMSQMSEQSRSVANDLLRLEMQLAMVNPSSVLNPDSTRSSRSRRSSSGSAAPRRSRISVVAPPGKLGIILANKADSRGTVVSGVRTSSVLADRISPGDRIVAIDGEDVSLMTVSEITTIMARKSEYDRTLTVLTTPKPTTLHSPESSSSAASPRDYRSRG